MADLRPHTRWHPWTVILPRGAWVTTYPTTNARIIVGIALAVGYVYALFGLVVFGIAADLRGHGFDLRPWQLDVLQGAGLFILTLAAVSTAQFALKRATARPELAASDSEANTGEPVTVAGTTPAPAGPETDPPHAWADGAHAGDPQDGVL